MRDNANQPLRASHHSSTILTDKSFKERALTASFYTKNKRYTIPHVLTFIWGLPIVCLSKNHWVATVCDSLLRHAQAVAAHICLCTVVFLSLLQDCGPADTDIQGHFHSEPFFCFICHDMIFDEVIFAPWYDCSMNVLANVAYP